MMNTLEHILRAVDEQMALNAFFHASPVPLTPGQVLEARCPRPVSGYMEPIEDFVEKFRPAGETPRRCAMYSTDKLEALDELAPLGTHVYEVEPLGHTTAADFAWIGGSAHYWRKDVEDAFMDMRHARDTFFGRAPWPATIRERVEAIGEYFQARARAKEGAENYWTAACSALDPSYGECPRNPEYLSPAIKILRAV